MYGIIDNMEQIDKKPFSHEIASIHDQIRLISELEHARSHALRSAVVCENKEDELHYLVLAKQARDLRRAFMKKHFPEMDSKDWCLCKSAATLRQIAYEIANEDVDFLRELDQLTDNIWGKALHKDLSGCESCAADYGIMEAEGEKQ